jgi:hypothetical protein
VRANWMRLCALCLMVLPACAAARTVEVKLKVAETEQVSRRPALVTTGVPFARGVVTDVRRLAVSIGDRPVPAQFIQLAPWDDGSVRWALMDVQVDVPAGATVELVVHDGGRKTGADPHEETSRGQTPFSGGGNPAPPAPVQAADGPGAVHISTGPLQFVVSKKQFNLFQSLTVDGKELLTPAGRGLVLYREDGGEVVAGPPTAVTVEQAGPLRAIVCVRGKFPGVHNDLLAYTVRLSAFAGQKAVKAQVWLENQGALGYYRQNARPSQPQPAPEWFAFRGLAVDLGLGLGANLSASCDGVDTTAGLKVQQVCRMSRSGRTRGVLYDYADLEYAITSGGKTVKTGDRTDGVVTLRGDGGRKMGSDPNEKTSRGQPPFSGGGGRLTVAIRDFWQNYEKAIEQDGRALRLWLWPVGGRWPRPRPDANIRDGEPLGKHLDRPDWTSARIGPYYLLPGGAHKGHEFVLDFSGRGANEVLADLSTPLRALASAEYYAATEAAPGLFAPPDVTTADKECNVKFAAWTRMLRSAADPADPRSLFAAPRTSEAYQVGYSVGSSHWYGWMDYGDLMAPGHGPVSLGYDWTWIALLGALRTGDPQFLKLAGPIARHRIDIDQFWSDRDLPEISGLTRTDTNYTSFHTALLRWVPEVRTNWLQGVVLYGMLTGEPKALECAARNAQGLRAAWDWIARTRPYMGPQTDMAANGWSIAAYAAMYRLTGDKQWLDDALGLFRKNVAPKWKAFGTFLHDPDHQIQQQDYIQEDMKYCYAVAPLCELHHLTGDEEVFALLKEGCEKPFPESFFEAPLYLSDLYGYVGLKTGKPELIRQGARFFAQCFPESKCPPVFLPGSTTWYRTSAMMLRTGLILQYANWKMKVGG